MVTKKNILVSSGIIVVLFLVFDSVGTFRLCGGVEYGSCMDKLHGFFGIFLPIFPLFLFSLITYKMREEIYKTWFYFARWWVPLSMLLVLISPEYSNDWMFPIEKGSVAFVTSLLFTVISLILIAWKWFVLRGKK